MSGGYFRFAVPPNPGTVRIRVGFTDCGESGGTAGAESATSQLPPPVLFSSVMFGLPQLVFALGSPADFNGLGISLCGVCKQSGTASASASTHDTERNRLFT